MKNKLLMKYPAAWWGAMWREAIPCGNGSIAAAVYGAVHEETVMLTHEDLWHLSETPELPDVSDKLAEVRALQAKGDFFKAMNLYKEELNDHGYEPASGTPLPLGDFNIKMPISKGFRHYRRELDMETGEATVSWMDGEVSYRRRLFVSRTDDVVVMEIEASDASLDLELGLTLHDENDRTSAVGEIVDLPADVEIQVEAGDGSGLIRYAARNDDGTDFGAVARVVAVLGTDATSEQAMPFSATENALQVKGHQRVLVMIKLFAEGSRESAWADLTGQLEGLRVNYEGLLAPHEAEHRELFERVSLDLGARSSSHELSNEELLLAAYDGEAPTALVEKMWAYGRYLLISSSRPGGKPCPLLGKWCGEYIGFWTFHMANENLQMIYWQALSGQMPETLLPVFDYFEDKMDDFRENAQKLYGCRGIYVPAVTTPESGLLKTIKPHIVHWTGGAAWVAQHFFHYYLYTRDENFLRNQALPFLRETALFYEDYFTIGADGYFQSSPSNSPENTPGNFWDGKGMGSNMEVAMNSSMDFSLAKEVLTNLVGAVTTLGASEDDEEVVKWKGMLEKIPPYQINEDGAVQEWIHPSFEDNYHHRHQSHIYPVFPGHEVTKDADPELFKAFEVAIEKRLQIGLSEQTGWSLIHMASVYARMRDGNQALDCMNLMSRSCLKNNFYTTHNDWRQMGIGVNMQWAPFQIDANMGWSSAVQEMLLFSVPGRISLLPALPDRWSRGSVKGLMAMGGIRLSIEWDVEKKQVRAELCSLGKDQTVQVQNAYAQGEWCDLNLKADEIFLLVADHDRSPWGLPVLGVS